MTNLSTHEEVDRGEEEGRGRGEGRRYAGVSKEASERLQDEPRLPSRIPPPLSPSLPFLRSLGHHVCLWLTGHPAVVVIDHFEVVCHFPANVEDLLAEAVWQFFAERRPSMFALTFRWQKENFPRVFHPTKQQQPHN